MTLLTCKSHQVSLLLETLLAPHSTQSETQTSPLPRLPACKAQQNPTLSSYLYGIAYHSLVTSLCFSHISLFAISQTSLKPWALLLYHISTGCFFCLDCHIPVMCLAKSFTSFRSLLKRHFSMSPSVRTLFNCNFLLPLHHYLHSQSPLSCLFFVSPLLACKFHESSSIEPSTQWVFNKYLLKESISEATQWMIRKGFSQEHILKVMGNTVKTEKRIRNILLFPVNVYNALV